MKHEEPGARRGAPALRYGGVNGRRDAAWVVLEADEQASLSGGHVAHGVL